MMDRRSFVVALTGGLLAASLPAEAQPAGKRWRIGWLSPASAATDAYELEALLAGRGKLNYVQGKTITVEARWGEGDARRLPELARALVERNVDILCTSGTPATVAAREATKTIPIVFGRAAFPEQTGLVASLARPGGNLTGVTFIGPEYGKRLELLLEVSAKIHRIALLYNDHNAASVRAMNETLEWAKTLRVVVEPLGVHDNVSLQAALASIRQGKQDAFLTTADPLLASYRVLIAKFASDHRIVAMYGDRAYVKAGGLMFYGTSTTDMWRHAAAHVDRILKGAKPGDLPVEQPKEFELQINLKAAKALGLTVPPSLLQRADQLIE
jgi:putative ABC transport system substrate-binding protein